MLYPKSQQLVPTHRMYCVLLTIEEIIVKWSRDLGIPHSWPIIALSLLPTTSQAVYYDLPYETLSWRWYLYDNLIIVNPLTYFTERQVKEIMSFFPLSKQEGDSPDPDCTGQLLITLSKHRQGVFFGHIIRLPNHSSYSLILYSKYFNLIMSWLMSQGCWL